MKIIIYTYLAGFILIAVFWRIYITWRQTGVNVVKLPARKKAHVAAAIVFVGAVSSHLLLLFLTAAGLLGYENLIPFRPLKGPLSSAIGALLLHASLVVMVAAQHRMGASWRIGIDDQSETKLVSGGIFRYSRNPIYLGLRLSFLALFLILPGLVTLIVVLCGEVSIQYQTRVEERYLAGRFGEAYKEYCMNTARWFSFKKLFAPGARSL